MDNDTTGAPAPIAPRYERRVALVQGLVQQDTNLNDTAARTLAIRVLHAIDTIPENVR